MRSIEEIEQLLERALQPEARGRLIARGEARAIIRRAGELPLDAPQFAVSIDADLADHGFAILDAALELRELDRQHRLLKGAFRTAGSIFESLVRNGNSNRTDRGFYRTAAAAAFHLASYAAVAYALFPNFTDANLNLSPAEKSLIFLILRDFPSLRDLSEDWLTSPENSDGSLTEALLTDGQDQTDSLSTAITTGFMRSLAYFEFALQTGDSTLVDLALVQLDAALGLAGETGHVSLWWMARLAKGLIADLWDSSLHVVLPSAPSSGIATNFAANRELFIASLFSQSSSQVELWPSQIKAAVRAADPEDDLVVALPTSAGKTRIAELAALTCLSQNKRVLIVTPLRALSAQTERSFRSTFAPLGFRVSSLYGASGLSSGDANALETDDIVVATPEKLDFALRNDPDIINDIGLIVLDEGHLIGPSEREVRYEILVQRLLRRADCDDRRIVCLSAILPEGEQLDDMTKWIRSDSPGDAVRSDWRPTNQRFGTLEWRNSRGALRYDLEEDGPFVSQFLSEMPASGGDHNPRPRDMKDLSLMSAWRFAAEDKRVLIFVTQANWVEGFAKRALLLVKKKYFDPLPVDQDAIKNALTIGEEWLGPDHPAVACLKIGMAIHHGGLPSPFLREIEKLLATGAIQVTAASPTLAQGLNLNAAVLLTPYIVRSGTPISGEEFANVAGRAGRAYVDTEGLILHVMEDNYDYRRNQWKSLVQRAKVRSLRSGLSQIIDQVVKKLMKRGVANSADGYEFLANSREDWLIEPADPEGTPIDDLVARLDAIIFGLVEALDANDDALPALLDEALSGSLWDRRMAGLDPGVRRLQQIVLHTRARLIWSSTTPMQRKGFFAMGVGLDSGLQLDLLSPALEGLLDKADMAALQGNATELHSSLVELASHLLTIKPFSQEAGKDLPTGWQNVLLQWLSGDPISEIGGEHTKLIEDAFVYRLVWAIEAIRTRRIAHGWDGGDVANSGMAASCLDAGLPDYRMAMLVRSGLPSRSASKQVVTELDPSFLERSDLRVWLTSAVVEERSQLADWPSPKTSKLWSQFREVITQQKEGRWSKHIQKASFNLNAHDAGVFRVHHAEDGNCKILTADFRELTQFTNVLKQPTPGIQYCRTIQGNQLEFVTIGPE
ncbi:DEAD/DEAH box helicase [Litoreibacter halocynthiae]|uniref:DEAD/DEAH box helicase n=1 Tax=Litoreibacter halocynthiae TaxID=1242689 RepID=UPI002491DA76|nr:DEAD/DEAH box helicase [Litoreibacter halocynthiae]